MSRKVSAVARSVLPIFCCVLSSVAGAQQFPQPPIRPSVDLNSVDLESGQLRLARTDIVIGELGAGGLSFGAFGIYPQTIAQQRWFLGAITTSTSPTHTVYTVSVDDSIESFDKAASPSNSPFVSIQGTGATLTQNSTTYTYTAVDGSVAVFSKSITDVGWGVAAATITSLTLSDGEIRKYTYVTVTACTSPGGTPGANCGTTKTLNRLQSVSNNRGYQITITYFDSRTNTTIATADAVGWASLMTSAMGINLAVDYCSPTANQCTGLTQSWPTVTYGAGVTDQLGNTTYYNWTGYVSDPLSIRWPGSQTDDVVYTFQQGAWPVVVTQVNRHGRTWSYAYTSTSTTRTTVVTDPANRQSTYVFDATTRSIKSYTNTAGEATTYQDDSNGRPFAITLPTGEILRYQYDLRGNLGQVNRSSYPPGSPDLVWQASYDTTCTPSTAKKCNKPNWTRDAAGNQTDYVYSTAHGNPTSITLPAQPNGIRPVTNYTYTSYQAYYKNSAGSIVGAGTNVYYLTSVAQCRTLASCTATSADQLRTDIGYGTNNVANNRLPVQTTGRDGAGTLIATTAIVYDNVGNVVSVDGPLSGTVDKTVTRYDALRRVIGTVGPDPDGTGPRTNIGVRTTYDSRGLPTVVETGNLPGQADTDWASFVASQSLAREFDADRRLTKVSSIAGSTTYAVQQVSFDTLGRVDCSTTRMNPAYFAQALPSACAATSPGSFGPDRIIQYAYDTADRVTSVTSGLGTPDAIIQQAMTYYTGGRLHTLADGKSNKTTYDYDPYGRLDHTYYPHPVNVGTSSTTDYEQNFYNAKSEITSVRRRSGDVIGTPRDALGRITQKDVPGTAEDVNFVYDNQGRLLSALYSSSGTPGIVQTYDGLGRLWTRTVFGRQLTYGYDLAGRRMRLTHPDGFFVTYGYSNVDELLTLTDSAGTTVATYGYDGLGARTNLTRPNNASTTYVPDAVKRLQQLTQDLSGTGFDVTATFAYNPAGQIASKTSSNDVAYTAVPSAGTTTAQFDGQNQLTNFAGTAVADDANANVWTGLGSLAYTYDALGQLRTGTGGVTVDYDPAGMLRRVMAAGTTTNYLYDGGDLIAEYDSSGNVLRRFVHGAGDDEPLVAYEGSGTGNKTWLHADERGSIVAASNSSGLATSSVKYTADGDSGALASPFGYTGQLYLPELQLYYYKARMYSAKAGRFMQPDPSGYDGGMNLYGYAGNDPVNLIDSFGLECGSSYVTGPPTYEGRDGEDRFTFPYASSGCMPPVPYAIAFLYHEDTPLSAGCGVYQAGAGGCPGSASGGAAPPPQTHEYKIRVEAMCFPLQAFEMIKKPGISAPGAPQAVEGITPNIRLSFNNPITQTVHTPSMTLVNTTQLGHRYYPGDVVWQVLPAPGGWSTIEITGTGTGEHAWENEFVGKLFFGQRAIDIGRACAAMSGQYF